MITVALIEDNVKLRNTVGDFLGVAGFSIYRYESVECFLEARLIPDCIITDVKNRQHRKST